MRRIHILVCLDCNHLQPVNCPCPHFPSLFGSIPLFSLIGCLVIAFLCCPFCSSSLCCSSYFHVVNGTRPPARLLVLNQISPWWLVNPARQSGSLVFIFSHFRMGKPRYVCRDPATVTKEDHMLDCLFCPLLDTFWFFLVSVGVIYPRILN